MGLEFSRQLIVRCGIIPLAVAAGQTRKARRWATRGSALPEAPDMTLDGSGP